MRSAMRKLITLTMSGIIIISMTGITVFAAEDTSETVSAEAYCEDAIVEAGDVNVTSHDGESGDVVSGIYAEGQERNTATVVTDDVTVTSEGESSAIGINARASFEGTCSVTANGDVTVAAKEKADGVTVNSVEGSSASVCVHGDVNVKSKYAIGVDVFTEGTGSADVVVDGNVTTVANESDSDNDVRGVCAGVYTGDVINITVNGDVRSSGKGIDIYDMGRDFSGALNIVVGGVVSANDIGVCVNDSEMANDIFLTAWKIDLNEEGKIAREFYYDEKNESRYYEGEWIDRPDIEKSIHYIIKLDQPTEGGVLSVDGTETIAGYDTAKEGETVLLKVNVKDGYRLAAAYNGKDQKLALKQDTDGNYYIVIPKGGGVYLSAVLEKIEETASENVDTNKNEIRRDIEKTNPTAKNSSVKKVSTGNESTKVSAPQTDDAGKKVWMIILAASLTGLIIARRNPVRGNGLG